MRYEKYKESNYVRLYNTIASWSNQPSIVKKMSLRKFGIRNYEYSGTTSRMRCVNEFCEAHPTFDKYADMKFGEVI